MQLKIRTLAMGLVLIALAGCGGGISEQVRSQVTYSGSFQNLQQDPEKLLGATVIFGGKIIATDPQTPHTDLLVLQLALDHSDRPEDGDRSEGRFIIRSRQFVDPALYPKGTLITIVGQLEGSEERLIGQMPYRYPVIVPLEIHKWSPRTDTGPRFHIGIGIGKTF
jgi:outer membrane lipoprotein